MLSAKFFSRLEKSYWQSQNMLVDNDEFDIGISRARLERYKRLQLEVEEYEDSFNLVQSVIGTLNNVGKKVETLEKDAERQKDVVRRLELETKKQKTHMRDFMSKVMHALEGKEDNGIPSPYFET